MKRLFVFGCACCVVMLSHGFKALDSEWWHFTLKDEPFPDTYFTFPVKQLVTK